MPPVFDPIGAAPPRRSGEACPFGRNSAGMRLPDFVQVGINRPFTKCDDTLVVLLPAGGGVDRLPLEHPATSVAVTAAHSDRVKERIGKTSIFSSKKDRVYKAEQVALRERRLHRLPLRGAR